MNGFQKPIWYFILGVVLGFITCKVLTPKGKVQLQSPITTTPERAK